MRRDPTPDLVVEVSGSVGVDRRDGTRWWTTVGSKPLGDGPPESYLPGVGSDPPAATHPTADDSEDWVQDSDKGVVPHF